MKQTITSINVLLLSAVCVVLGLSINKLWDKQVKLSSEIGRLEKAVELINDSNKTIGYSILPQSSFDNMTPEGYTNQILTNYFTIKFTDCKN